MPAFNRLTNNIWQGSYPESIERGKSLGILFDVIINVDDSPDSSLEGQNVSFYHRPIHYWFPINEWSVIPYEIFYAVKRVIDHNSDKKVLIHCAAGVNRSNLVAYSYLFSHDLHHLMPDFAKSWKRFIEGRGASKAPPMLERFLKIMTISNPSWSVISILNEIFEQDKADIGHPIEKYLNGLKN